MSATKITVKTSKGKGRGLFATERIRKGEVIEAAPVLLVPRSDGDALTTSFLGNYLFQTDDGKRHVLGLGLTSLINHDNEPNAEFYASTSGLVIKALRTIQPGTEVTIDYGWGAEDWARVGVDPGSD